MMPDIAALRMVRGGSGREDVLLRAALFCYAKRRRPGLSIFAANLPDAVLVDAAGESLPHSKLQFGWTRCLTDCGFDVEQTGKPPHHTVWLPDVTAETLASFRECFEPTVDRTMLAS